MVVDEGKRSSREQMRRSLGLDDADGWELPTSQSFRVKAFIYFRCDGEGETLQLALGELSAGLDATISNGFNFGGKSQLPICELFHQLDRGAFLISGHDVEKTSQDPRHRHNWGRSLRCLAGYRRHSK
eukprot:CCRYP_007745-RB/>CCRYP_007745-RB protein AED:0.42 eAED:0.74 QI:0/0/0.5/1/1/1/2/283/127